MSVFRLHFPDPLLARGRPRQGLPSVRSPRSRTPGRSRRWAPAPPSRHNHNRHELHDQGPHPRVRQRSERSLVRRDDHRRHPEDFGRRRDRRHRPRCTEWRHHCRLLTHRSGQRGVESKRRNDRCGRSHRDDERRHAHCDRERTVTMAARCLARTTATWSRSRAAPWSTAASP